MVRLKLSRRVLATAVCAAAIGTSASIAAEGTGYEMISYVDVPGGRSLIMGDRAAAIDMAARLAATGPLERRLAASSNLCVAYTLERRLTEAADACDRAVELAQRVDAKAAFGVTRSHAETAKAMTNRGVLKAVSGDMSGASEDFRAAAGMRGASMAPVRNLARVEGAGYRLAAAETGD